MAGMKGMEIFRKHFSEFKDSYVIIGGTACSLIFEDLAVDFRVTHDIDMVVVIDEVDTGFKKHFLEFIYNGKYRSRKTGKHSRNYRFEKPENSAYPESIELFARIPVGLENYSDARIAPIEPLDDEYHLSGILLDDEYYDFLLKGRTELSEIMILDALHLIPLKVYAWYRLTVDPPQREQGIENNIEKHRLDVIDLSGTLLAGSRLQLSGDMAATMNHFISALKSVVTPVSPGYANNERLEFLKKIYL